MTTVEEQQSEPGQQADTPAPAAHGRRELSDWQAQLLALGITIGLITLFVLLFSLLTGSL